LSATTLSAPAEAAPRAASPWIYGPWLDLLVGCGAWSAPLLLLGTLQTGSRAHAWAIAFYALAMVFNYPHFMATVYRAYRSREEISRYRVFTLHLTLLLALTAVLAHASFPLLPWVFTLYLCWSPWHYTGQNFGLMMMFVRRGGATISAGERRLLHLAFIASYAMLLVSFHTDASHDPYVISLGLSHRISVPARVVLCAAYVALGLIAFARLAKRSSLRAMVAPATLFLTQGLWFVVPTMIAIGSGLTIPQTRYSSGLLAVLHSTQYLWITSYYQQREARASGNTAWRMSTYFATLVAGGIALFIPGPWIVSLAFHYDFTASFMIFAALVNIHHFILDGAIWKLRDSRIAALLVGGGSRSATAAGAPETAPAPANKSFGLAGRIVSARAFRVALAAALFLWGGLDQFHFFLAVDENNLPRLERAEKLDPYDSGLQMRIAHAASLTGNADKADAALALAVAANPANPGPQHARARALLLNRRYDEAYSHYRQMLKALPRDPDALVNFGMLAARLGHEEEAMDSFQQAIAVDPKQSNAHLYLAQKYDGLGQPLVAARHYQAYLDLIAAHAGAQPADPRQIIRVTLALADDLVKAGRPAPALGEFQAAAALAESSGETRSQSLALARSGELLEQDGDAAAAARAYQRALALDTRGGGPLNEAIDWFNYGQFLRRAGQPERLAYACFVHAEELLASLPGKELDTVQKLRKESEARLGNESAAVRKNLSTILRDATALELGAAGRKP
jgi:tetratricopeptide (TPR) repeat protein